MSDNSNWQVNRIIFVALGQFCVTLMKKIKLISPNIYMSTT